MSDINVGDRVRVLVGSRKGEEGRVVVRRFKDAFGIVGVIYEVDFEDCPRIEPGYFTIQFQPKHLERIDP